jgi:predicted nucleotidyltransferase
MSGRRRESRARGEAVADSDWDLLVVVPDDLAEDDLDPLISWRLQKGSGVRAEIVPCRVTDFAEDRGTPNTLAYEAATRGLRVYER